MLLNFGKHNAAELFTEKLTQLLGNWSDYVQFSQTLFLATGKTQQGLEALEQNGVLSFWIMQSLKIAESPGEVTLDDRITSLVFLCEMWLNQTEFFDT